MVVSKEGAGLARTAVSLMWATPDIDRHIAHIARVSNPDNQNNPNIEGLLAYMMREGHTSPFEMANVCLEINTTRDIGRQILRHRSFSFQEFSQRYQDVEKLSGLWSRECRMQDAKNRQNSVETDDAFVHCEWEQMQEAVMEVAMESYRRALDMGIAKEQARAFLPEGLTPSRIYMNGNLRSWIFYLMPRTHESNQKEHRAVAEQALKILRELAPVTMNAFFPQH